MEHVCVIPFRPSLWLAPATARELAAMTPVSVVLDCEDDLISRVDGARKAVGHCSQMEAFEDDDKWWRVRATLILNEASIPDVILQGLADGRVRVGLDASIAPHHCKGDTANTLVLGVSKLDAFALVPEAAAELNNSVPVVRETTTITVTLADQQRVRRLVGAAGDLARAAKDAMVLMNENGLRAEDEYTVLNAAIDGFEAARDDD
jgi:hypothetical protein